MQPSKAQRRISITESDRVTLFKDLQSLNASTLIHFTELGILMLSIELPLNASCQISVTESGIIVVEHPQISLLECVMMIELDPPRESKTGLSASTSMLLNDGQ